MTVQIVPVTDDADFDEIAHLQREAFTYPVSRLIELISPIDGPEPHHKDASNRAMAERFRLQNRTDPSTVWIKAVDGSTAEKKKMLGAARWNIYESDPYVVPLRPDCHWWAEGDQREIANEYMRQHWWARQEYMRRPHVMLAVCFVSSGARGKGVGGLLVNWGVQEADRRGLDAWVDATEAGKPLYSKFGFVEGPVQEFSLSRFPDTDTLETMKATLLPYSEWPMYRPAGGVYEKGTTKLPWEERR